MTNQFHKYAIIHLQMYNLSCNQEYEHQDKKVKFNGDSKQNVRNIDFFKQHNDFTDCHSSVQAD